MRIIKIGASQYFFLTLKNCQNSLIIENLDIFKIVGENVPFEIPPAFFLSSRSLFPAVISYQADLSLVF